MAALAAAQNPLWSFLWGKRRSRRMAVSLATQLSGPKGGTSALAVDVSRHGALIKLAVADLAALGGGRERSSHVDLSRLLGDELRIEFPGGVHARARAVRASWRPGHDDAVYVGCEFHATLANATLLKLGVDPRICAAERGPHTPSAALMSYVADPDQVLTLDILFSSGDRPLSGPLLGVHGAALATRLAPADPTDIVARLSRKPHKLVARDAQDAPLWKGEGYLLAVRVVEGGAAAVEVVLTASPTPTQAVRRRLKRRATAPAAAVGET